MKATAIISEAQIRAKACRISWHLILG